MTGQSYWGSWLASSMSPRTLRLWTALSDAWTTFVEDLDDVQLVQVRVHASSQGYEHYDDQPFISLIAEQGAASCDGCDKEDSLTSARAQCMPYGLVQDNPK